MDHNYEASLGYKTLSLKTNIRHTGVRVSLFCDISPKPSSWTLPHLSKLSSLTAFYRKARLLFRDSLQMPPASLFLSLTDTSLTRVIIDWGHLPFRTCSIPAFAGERPMVPISWVCHDPTATAQQSHMDTAAGLSPRAVQKDSSSLMRCHTSSCNLSTLCTGWDWSAVINKLV